MKRVILAFAFSCIAVPVWAVGVTPSNVMFPTLPGEPFSFDLIVSDAMDANAMSFQSTISMSGPGVLTFDVVNSKAVGTAAPGYWVFGNSGNLNAFENGGTYIFADFASDPTAELLFDGDIMARYAFTWDGTAGDYTFSLDLDTAESFIQNDSLDTEPLEFTPGPYPGDISSFTVTVPEPTTLMFLALGSALLLKKRKT